MGLLKEALLSSTKTNNAQKGGLLAKITRNSNAATTFKTWAEINNFEHVAVLESSSSKYYISQAIGIDAETISSSVSTCDFWNGTITDCEWFIAEFGTKKAEPFYQFLSQNFKDTVKGIAFSRLSMEQNSPILMLLSFHENMKTPLADKGFKETLAKILLNANDSEIIQDSNIDFSKTAFLYLLSLQLVLDNFALTLSNENSTLNDKICKVLYKEIYFFIQKTFEKHHIICQGNNNEIKIAMLMNQEVDTTFLQSYIAKSLNPILNEELTSKLLLLSAGTTKKQAVVHNFLITG